ncbi:glycosyltransferase family 9 protein [Candidatus Omnitrophota bacterium]
MKESLMLPDTLMQKENLRILITRTDRIGDLVLSTPVLSEIKKKYPQCFLAVMTLPSTAQLLENNPAIDEIIIYDKRGTHKQWWRHVSFVSMIRSKKFDCAIHLHPTNRVHWISFLSSIPVRIGYNRKSSFLLTHKCIHEKQQGKKHEGEYNFDLLSYLNIPCPKSISPQFYVCEKDNKEFDSLLKHNNIVINETSFIINPGASCSSKMWPAKRFATLANTIAENYNLIPIVIGDRHTKQATDTVKKHLKVSYIDFSEARLTLRLLGVLFSRARFLISNDTGVVHLATAVGLPVVAIFGRSQKGLGPTRWRPLGEKSYFLHKPPECITCEAHNCTKAFKCLSNIEIEDILTLLKAHKEMFQL